MFEISASCSPCGGLVVVLAMEGLLRPTTSAAFGTGALTPIAALAETWRHAQPHRQHTDCGPVSKAKSQVPRTAESLLVHPQMGRRLHDRTPIPANRHRMAGASDAG